MDVAIKANSVRSLNSKDKTAAQSSEYIGLFKKYWEDHIKKGIELCGRDKIIRAVCPQLYGLYGVKLAVLLTLIGGTDLNKIRVKEREKAELSGVGSELGFNSQDTSAAVSDKRMNFMKTRCQSHLLIGKSTA